MTFNEYQELTAQTAIYPNRGSNPVYPALGLCGEAGEVAEKVKKLLRDDGGVISAEKRTDVAKELGDVLWYVSQVASEFGLDLHSIAKGNLDKLFSRKERGVLGGSGDNR
jgi:NTP pyrophosphatase (non-canonical NTP hydrolase)